MNSTTIRLLVGCNYEVLFIMGLSLYKIENWLLQSIIVILYYDGFLLIFFHENYAILIVIGHVQS